jgi:hypothetical protein
MGTSAADYEKLGSFYLGKDYDVASKTRHDTLVLYDSRDLVTHAVCVGMTGSGKTGLCLTILEEAAIDGIPAIVIDPKGDLSNLLLTFPDLKPSDFRPWINEDDAKRKGVSPDDFAAQQAQMWSKGLADWQEDGDRVRRFKQSADFAIYTPGSNAGLPVSVLKSFDAPESAILEEAELLRDRIATTVASLLGLLNIQGDPMQSRENILLSAIFNDAWTKGQDLDLPTLIQRIQQPPFQKLGVMELESVYPGKDRFGLAMAMNNLVASPGFSAWLEGEPLDIGAMLHTKAGKPRVAIFSIAHLSDAERMFFVSLLLNQTLGWVRTQTGTSSLRALVYMDEIAGYFPPVANPPSKQPLLMLMKQARAFGVGIVLATQNPVDLDYKGLANAGTWFIGRLQTDRDKQRVLDGLEGAAAQASSNFDRASCDKLLSQLSTRIFLMNNVHDTQPRVIETRWALSYLRGPLTRNQIKTLMDPVRGSDAIGVSRPAAAAARSGDASSTAGPPASSSGTGDSARPILPAEIKQFFIPARASSGVTYAPVLLGSAKVYYQDAKSGVDQDVPTVCTVPFGDGPVLVDWDRMAEIDIAESDLESEPIAGAAFGTLPGDATKAKSYDAWKKGFSDAIFRVAKLDLMKSDALGELSKPGESKKDFRVRLTQAARERRDAASEKLRTKYAPKFQVLQDRLRRAQQAVQAQKQQSMAAKLSTAVSFGAAVLGAFTGRKITSATEISKASSAIRGVGRAMKESGDVGRSEETVEAVQQQLNDLQAQFDSEVASVAGTMDPTTEQFERITLRPKKTNITVRTLVLAWAPYANDQPAW